ncbi:MAG: N-acetylmuramoyl-L-alanine amidase [Firmicutes bacterium]|nr:N-acetylmuramoyl-L-alanine amidase [Bacillota bacterium]
MNVKLFVQDEELMQIQESVIPAILAVCNGIGARTQLDHQNRTLHINSFVEGKVIVLDPGHGGQDQGGTGFQGYVEAHETLDIALRLRALLISAGAAVIMTRDTARAVSTRERIKIANKTRPSLILSIHASEKGPAGKPGVTAYYSYLPFFRSRRLAQSLARGATLAGLMDEGVRMLLSDPENEDYFRLLAGTWAPSAVVECGCPEKTLLTPDFRQRCADGLYQGIVNYFRPAAERFGKRPGTTTSDQVTVPDRLPAPMASGPPGTFQMPATGQLPATGQQASDAAAIQQKLFQAKFPKGYTPPAGARVTHPLRPWPGDSPLPSDSSPISADSRPAEPGRQTGQEVAPSGMQIGRSIIPSKPSG